MKIAYIKVGGNPYSKESISSIFGIHSLRQNSIMKNSILTMVILAYAICVSAQAVGLKVVASGHVGIGTANPVEKLEVDGALKIGSTTTTNPGTIRFEGDCFQGYDGTSWVDIGGSGCGGGSGGGGGSACNVALNGTATQINTWGGLVASNAIDGNTDPVWTSGSTTATTNAFYPWWQVDLGQSENIDSIKLYSVAHNPPKLKNFYVFLSNSPYSAGATISSLLNDSNVSNTYISTVSDIHLINSGLGNARYIRVQLNYRNTLEIAECEVYTDCSVPIVAPITSGSQTFQEDDNNSNDSEDLFNTVFEEYDALYDAYQKLENKLEQIESRLDQKGIPLAPKNKVFLGQNYPNPTNSATRIPYEFDSTLSNVSFVITDIIGNQLFELPLSSNEDELELDLDQLESGNYIYSLNSNDTRIVSKKLIISK